LTFPFASPVLHLVLMITRVRHSISKKDLQSTFQDTARTSKKDHFLVEFFALGF
jgi:hypothetical protein